MKREVFLRNEDLCVSVCVRVLQTLSGGDRSILQHTIDPPTDNFFHEM